VFQLSYKMKKGTISFPSILIFFLREGKGMRYYSQNFKGRA
jgi:hypothetical protein